MAAPFFSNKKHFCPPQITNEPPNATMR